jgi:hypothetical protein
MPPIVANLTLGALAAAVVPTATTVVTAIILVTTGLAIGGLTIIGGGVALATIWAAIAAVAMARLICVRLARSTNRVVGSTRSARVGVEAKTHDCIRRGGPVCRLILLLLKSLER